MTRKRPSPKKTSAPRKVQSKGKSVPEDLLARLEMLDCASLCDASPLTRAFSPGLLPLHEELKMAGRARTIGCSNDYLAVVKALSEAERGEVLVIDGRGQNYAVFGELLAAEAQRRGVRGAIIDGAIRDVSGLRGFDFPIFYRCINPRAGRAETIEPHTSMLSICGVVVAEGDYIFGDADGIVVLPADQAEAIIAVAEEIQCVESKVLNSVIEGESLTRILKFEEFCREHDRDIRTKLDFHLSEK